MGLDDDIIGSKYGDDFTRQVSIVFRAYELLPDLPAYSPVKKGDILRATPLVKSHPIFGGSQMLILGLEGKYAIGTSLKGGHPAFLCRAEWDLSQLADEVAQYKLWDIIGSLGTTSINDYFVQLNVPRN